MAATWRRIVWPTEATDCSASLSGSASLTATSVMAEAIRRSSCARQTSSARNQKMAIGTRMATAAVSAAALPNRPVAPAVDICAEISPKAKKPPMTNQITDAASAIRKGVRDGRCCSANINPPIEGKSSLAGGARRRCGGGPAGRRVRVNCFGAAPAEGGGVVSANSSRALPSSCCLGPSRGSGGSRRKSSRDVNSSSRLASSRAASSRLTSSAFRVSSRFSRPSRVFAPRVATLGLLALALLGLEPLGEG